METTYADALDHFAARSDRAAALLAEWRSDPTKREVVPFVERFRTHAAYEVSPDDILAVAHRTEHALGNVRRSVAESVQRIVDWHSAFAFEHVLHYALEALGHVPTYQEFRSFCREDEAALHMLGLPTRVGVEAAVEAGEDRSAARSAMRWRVGNAYYSFLKELYVLSLLRASGADARFHLLADVLFRVDAWVGDICILLYVPNPRYRQGSKGRKPSAVELLSDGPFRFEAIDLPVRHKFGEVYLPDRADVVAVAARLKTESE